MTDNTMAKMKKDKRTSNDLQNITHKTKDRTTQKKPGVNSCAPVGQAVPAALVTLVVTFNLVNNRGLALVCKSDKYFILDHETVILRKVSQA